MSKVHEVTPAHVAALFNPASRAAFESAVDALPTLDFINFVRVVLGKNVIDGASKRPNGYRK